MKREPEAYEILEEIRGARTEVRDGAVFGPGKLKKFSGAVAVEVIREHLKKNGFRVSARDVFIKGVSAEIDLLVVRPGGAPKHGVLYDPSDVLAALEIKAAGSFGENTLKRVGEVSTEIRDRIHVWFAYLTVCERCGCKWAIPKESAVGCPAFTMFWHDRGPENLQACDDSGDWNRLLGELKSRRDEEVV